MRISLAPIDYYFFRPNLYTIQFVFEYDRLVDIEKIKRGLALTIKQMPVVSSRLRKVSNFEVVLETGYEIPIREQRPDYNQRPESNPEIFLDSIENEEGKPLIKILVSDMKTRSCVGISFSHLLGDGASFFQFLGCLSQMIVSSKSEFMSSPVRLKCAHSNNNQEDLFRATGYLKQGPPTTTAARIENLFYDHECLLKTKAECKKYGTNVTSNDIIMADLSKKFYRDIPTNDGKFIVRCPVDYRATLNLPSDYFGNAVRDAVTEFTHDELNEMSLAQIACRIRETILGIDRQNINRSLEALDQFRHTNGIDAFQELGCPGLLVTNISKFPVSKIDLGSGSPICFHHASHFPRLALILDDEQGLRVKFHRPIPSFCIANT